MCVRVYMDVQYACVCVCAYVYVCICTYICVHFKTSRGMGVCVYMYAHNYACILEAWLYPYPSPKAATMVTVDLYIYIYPLPKVCNHGNFFFLTQLYVQWLDASNYLEVTRKKYGKILSFPFSLYYLSSHHKSAQHLLMRGAPLDCTSEVKGIEVYYNNWEK